MLEDEGPKRGHNCGVGMRVGLAGIRNYSRRLPGELVQIGEGTSER